MYFYNTSRNSNGYDTFSNDVWSLGVILVTLLSGKNPWKCANLKDPAFASFVANPRCFFQTVIPNISKSLNRILLDVFCLDPSKRIRLNELRSMFLRCHRFTVESVPTIKTALSPVSTKKPPVPSYELPCTKSFESTIIEYIGHYKEETEVSKAQHTASTSHRISYLSIYSNSTGSTCSLSSTSSFSGESPSTPRNGSPVLNYFIPKPKHLDLGFP
jgi:serine/threonine protein kinase